MDLEGKGDSSAGSQISKPEDLKSPKGTRNLMTKKTKKNLLKKATKAGPQLAKHLKIKCMIKERVKLAQERKFKELALKKYAKDKPLQDGIMRSDKLRSKRKVTLVEPSLKSIRPKMLARRPTPLPCTRKRKENRSKTLPKFVPLCQKKNHVVKPESSEE
ncbi:uncharacterized protein LOC122612974 [Drosophila teissieri]|uniref:uncharacterized protein LOC122612974 n=1 Tax=Drosophila teissieri TaxID=7243 RepID=UPI001CBA0C95|nr:uncharacterized protein LOC122612974 [Drosophila teissieri]